MSSPSSIAASSLSFAVLLLAWPAAAQTQAAGRDPGPPAAQEGAPAEAADSPDAAAEGDAEEEGYVPEDEAPAQEKPALKSSPPTTPSAASLNAHRRVRDPKRVGRIVTEVLLGSIGSLAGLWGGMSIGGAFYSSLGSETSGYIALAGQAVGMTLVTPLFVLMAGTAWQGQGQPGSTFMGAFVGLGVLGACWLATWGASFLGQMALNAMMILTFTAYIAPLVGAVAGYELSHLKVLRSGGPTPVPLRIKGGAGVALAWAI